MILEFLRALANLLNPLAQLAEVFLRGPTEAAKAIVVLAVLVIFIIVLLAGIEQSISWVWLFASSFLTYVALMALLVLVRRLDPRINQLLGR